MIGNDFYFGEHWLSEFDMKVYDPDNQQEFVGRDIDRADITSLRPVPNHYSTKYSDVLKLDFLIVKDPDIYESNELKMDGDDISYVRAWLESPKKPTHLICPLESDDSATNYYGIFTDVKPYTVGNECYGLYLTFTCNSPYGFSDMHERTYIVGSGVSTTGTFMNVSAEYNEYLKPIVTIISGSTFGSNDGITIQNQSDDNKEMTLVLPEGLSSVVIDCQKKIITDGEGNILTMADIGLTLPISDGYNFVSSEMYLFYWLRLVPNFNKLVFTTPEYSTVIKVKIDAQYIVKSGGF